MLVVTSSSLCCRRQRGKNVTIIDRLNQYQILRFTGYTIIPELKKKIGQNGKVKVIHNEGLVRLSECKVELLEIQVFHDLTLWQLVKMYQCISVSKDHSAFNTSANVQQSAQCDILQDIYLQYGTSLFIQLTWYSQVREGNANRKGQPCILDKKKKNTEFWCGNFLKDGHFEKYGRHLRTTGCEYVKCFRTLYRLHSIYC